MKEGIHNQPHRQYKENNIKLLIHSQHLLPFSDSRGDIPTLLNSRNHSKALFQVHPTTNLILAIILTSATRGQSSTSTNNHILRPTDKMPKLSKNSFIFAPGDVDLSIKLSKKGRPVTGKGSSEELIGASTVWKNAIVSRQKVDFTDHNPEAVLILLNIVHSKFDEVPRKLSYRLLYDVAILVDKYDCIRAVKSFVDSWFDSGEDADKHGKDGHEGWLFIA
jgi:hypothetical protein